MPAFTKTHAEKFSKKLKTKPKDDSLLLRILENRDGAHIQHQIWHGEKYIAAFGIKHGSSKDASHGWVARELQLSPKFAVDFANCNETIDAMIQKFVDKGWIESAG